ncbi:MAG TPA: T9SS type A sorting domain-containing protein [Saprospiraceae bacterium]|nr:T9SS type A sorting domain-containing protein [Saprospiraceae bacterium]
MHTFRKYSLLIWLPVLFFTPLQGQQKQLYIANDDHTDYFWTADDVTYRNAFINQLDYYIGLMETQNDTLPYEFQHRYNCDNSLWVYEYEKAKSGADFNRLIDKMKSGHITVPFNPLVPVYGGQNAEIALRGMYYGGYLERRYGIDIDLAVMMENQTLPLGISSLWAGAGAKYSWKGVCSCASPYLNYHDREHEVYYSKGRDGNGVLMKWYDLITNQHLGGYAECRYPNEAIADLSEKCNTPKYPFHVAGAFGYGWDDLENYLDFFPQRARQNTNATQQVIVSNEIDFFEKFVGEYHNSIPTQSVSFGNDWDLLVATMAKVSGDVKYSSARLRTAEAMATLVALKDTSFASDLVEEKELAWMSLGKYYDHDWTADGPVSSERAQFQRDMEANFTSYVDTLYDRATKALGDQIIHSGNAQRYYVFNPLSWSRTDIADIPYTGSLPVAVYDVETQEEVPTQFIHKSGVQYVRILATDVPAVGYKVYQLDLTLPTDLSLAISFTDSTYENNFFALSITPNGTITSFKDKRQNNFEYNGGNALNDFQSGDPSSGSQVIWETPGPVSGTVSCNSNSPYPHTTEITFYRDVPRIDITNHLRSNPGNQATTFSFPINVDNPVVWHEEIGAVIKAKLEVNGGHYANQNARYDWQTANHFVHIGNESRGMTISNQGSHFFKLGESTIEALDESSHNVKFLASGKVAYGSIGINNQGGDTSFLYKYALQPHIGDFDQTASMKMAMEHQHPFATGLVGGGNDYPETTFSLLSISDPDVLLWALKPAEEGAAKGVIARVWNQAAESNFMIDGTMPITSAMHTSHVETDISPVSVSNANLDGTIGDQEMKTYRIFFQDSVITSAGFVVSSPWTHFRVQPNPARDIVKIYAKDIADGKLTITLINNVGQQVRKSEVNYSSENPEIEYSLNGIPSGIYFLTIHCDSRSETFSIIVQ